jgi:predicted amidohydrolase
MKRLLVALVLLSSLCAAAPSHAASSTSGCAGRAPTLVPGHGQLQVFAMQYKQDVDTVATYSSIHDYVFCYFARYVAPYRDPKVPGLVVFNELTAILFGAEGSRGAPARGFAHTPAATVAGQATNEPLGALGGAIGLVAATHARELAYYAARFPTANASLARVFLAVTDTYVRSVEDSFAAAARRFHVTVVVGAPLPILNGGSVCTTAGYLHWLACPGWRSSTNPADVTALADPDLVGQERSVYVAVTSNVENVGLVFGPDGRLVDLQPKVNLTPIEVELGWTPAPMNTVHAIPLPGDRRVRLGIAISLDAFENEPSPHPCARTASFVGCLAARQVNLLLQPEFNDGTPQTASWSDVAAACSPGAPAWQQLAWMQSSWYDVRTYPAFRYAVNPFMVGNLYDLTGDGQTAIFARADPRARPAAYVGDVHPVGGPPDPSCLRRDEGAQPGFLGLTPWVVTGSLRDDPRLPLGSPRSLESCEDGLVSGSGVRAGPCREDAYLVTAVIAELRLP